ncbi:DUF2737 family protein [Enterobacter cloacae]
MSYLLNDINCYPNIPREEMLKKNSFPSVNENKFLTAWLKQMRGKK